LVIGQRLAKSQRITAHPTTRLEASMQRNRNQFWTVANKVLAVVTVALVMALMLAPDAWAASTQKVLYSFTGGSDGNQPMQGLIFDQAGNLYGATWLGGDYGYGAVFQLTPNLDGSWSENVLYSFTGGSDGANPEWGGLALDAANNLYGTTNQGGEYGVGNVFELSPNSDGTWTQSVLHQFTGKSDGGNPMTTPLFDQAGNLYAAATGYGAYGCGAAFKMTPSSNNQWTYRVIQQGGTPACWPWAGLTPDGAGGFYGTTRDGGYWCQQGSNCGNVFQLTPTSDGKWTHKLLHRFTGGKAGSDPATNSLVLDRQGNLYGALEGGAYGYGLLYRLAPSVGGKGVTYQVLYRFKGLQDGSNPGGGMVFDAAGNLYGPTLYGGAYGYGVVFKLTPNQDGSWTESVIHNFSGTDGANPARALISDPAGNFYGITTFGGAYGAGTVYEITP
jgi:uncharacterized repeat protein (TIGR03803 family)